jgi:hypothetical protein
MVDPETTRRDDLRGKDGRPRGVVSTWTRCPRPGDARTAPGAGSTARRGLAAVLSPAGGGPSTAIGNGVILDGENGVGIGFQAGAIWTGARPASVPLTNLVPAGRRRLLTGSAPPGSSPLRDVASRRGLSARRITWSVGVERTKRPDSSPIETTGPAGRRQRQGDPEPARPSRPIGHGGHGQLSIAPADDGLGAASVTGRRGKSAGRDLGVVPLGRGVRVQLTLGASAKWHTSRDALWRRRSRPLSQSRQRSSAIWRGTESAPAPRCRLPAGAEPHGAGGLEEG